MRLAIGRHGDGSCSRHDHLQGRQDKVVYLSDGYAHQSLVVKIIVAQAPSGVKVLDAPCTFSGINAQI
jgi:hypothetical protein